ncbi:hypothetical protein FK535_01195 [Mycolicibacterium sp. 018/SC-01/001]|nr:hypothetical protein FK535_01195 [Mycolicibacterium sp. 018/SC-01/001]
MRGAAAGLVTTALALAAHATGGGHLAVGPAVVELLLVGATVGAIATALPRARGIGVLALLLAAGQLVGHAVLAVAHPAVGTPGGVMVVAHVAAVLLGALLISAGERLCRALVRVVRRTAAPTSATVFAPPARRLTPGDQPLVAELLLAASMSHRGPPVAG